jgi:tetratricopeptide (TPR) repeat protein
VGGLWSVGPGDQGDHDRAIACFTEAIRLAPKFANAYYARAFAREITGDFEQALADFTRVLELVPASLDQLVMDWDGSTSRVVLRTEESLERRIVHNDSGLDRIEMALGFDIARVAYKHGVQCVEAGDHDRAIADFSEALRRSAFAQDYEQPWEAGHPAGITLSAADAISGPAVSRKPSPISSKRWTSTCRTTSSATTSDSFWASAASNCKNTTRPLSI